MDLKDLLRLNTLLTKQNGRLEVQINDTWQIEDVVQVVLEIPGFGIITVDQVDEILPPLEAEAEATAADDLLDHHRENLTPG